MNGGSTAAVQIDLTTLDCGGGVATVGQIHALYVFMGNGGLGPVYLDKIRAD